MRHLHVIDHLSSKYFYIEEIHVHLHVGIT